MKIEVRKVASLYAPKLWWVTSSGTFLSIAEWETVGPDEDITDYWTKEIEPLTDEDKEDFSGATEGEFGR